MIVCFCTAYYVGTNVDALEKLIKYGVSVGLRYEPSEHPLLIVEDPFCFGDHRKRLAEIMFEKLGFPAIYFLKSAPCIGYPLSPRFPFSFSMGKTTCMSVDFGASGIRIVPVYDGYSLMSCPLSIVL